MAAKIETLERMNREQENALAKQTFDSWWDAVKDIAEIAAKNWPKEYYAEQRHGALVLNRIFDAVLTGSLSPELGSHIFHGNQESVEQFRRVAK
jgi:hypothetical protein